MKRFLLIFLLTSVLFFCYNGDMKKEQEDLFSGDNPFVGTWVSTNSVDFGGDAFKIIFSEVKFENDVPNTFILKDGELYDYKQDYPIIGKFRFLAKDINGEYQKLSDDKGYIYDSTNLKYFSYRRVDPDWPIFDTEIPYNFYESKILVWHETYKKVSKQTF